MICLYMWIEWLSVVDIEFMYQKSYVWICCVFCEKWWIMKLWFDELGMNSWIIVVVDVWKTCCWWVGMMIMPMVIWWWKLLLLWNSFWKFGEISNWDKIMFDSWVLSILLYVFMYMTYKQHLGRVLSVEGSKLECLGKRVLKFEVFILDWRVFT